MSDEPRIPTEHEEQREFVCWFKQTYKGVRIFAIPNGGLRGRAAAGKLKAEGVEFIEIDNRPFFQATAPVRAKYGAPYADLMNRIAAVR